MLISHKKKFITIDIPKTGTRSLRETLTPLDIVDIAGQETGKFCQHSTALGCMRDLGSKIIFKNYFSFCIVRNPWERYLSFFKYYKDKAEKYLKTTDFKEWKDSKIKQGKYAADLFKINDYHRILKSIIINQKEQSYYFLNKNKDIIVSHIARFENLQTEFDYLCETVDLKKNKLSHGNKSITQIFCSDIYNQELIDLVAEKEHYLINFKKYEFPSP